MTTHAVLRLHCDNELINGSQWVQPQNGSAAGLNGGVPAVAAHLTSEEDSTRAIVSGVWHDVRACMHACPPMGREGGEVPAVDVLVPTEPVQMIDLTAGCSSACNTDYGPVCLIPTILRCGPRLTRCEGCERVHACRQLQRAMFLGA